MSAPEEQAQYVAELESRVGALEDELADLRENYADMVRERDALQEKVKTALDEANELVRGLAR